MGRSPLNGNYVDNILRVWDQADPVDFTEGMLAYHRYRQTLDRIAQHYHVQLSAIVGMFCSLSPNTAYMTNLRAVVSVLNGYRGAGYGACRDRAIRCMRGEQFLDFTRGLKTRNFYQNIMDPDDPEPVTIDGHAYSVYDGQYHTMRSQVLRRKFPYHTVADTYRECAIIVGGGLLPNQLQSVTWFTWKRIHQVIFEPQLHLYRAALHDQWMLDLHPDEVPPFPLQENNATLCPSTKTESTYTPKATLESQPDLFAGNCCTAL